MEIGKAIQIINDKREIYGMSLFDMVVVMNQMLEDDDGSLTQTEENAIRVFMREGRKMFAPLGA
jgi:hypothetical protein